MLGGDLVEEARAAGLSCVTSDREVDITDAARVRAFAEQHRPAWIINAAAYTAVDQAEREPALAMAINGDGPGHLGAAAAAIGAVVVHFSTDYVFDGHGDRPWVEADPTGPLSSYGRSKLAGERRLAEATDRFFIFRISWLYGVRGKNFVKTVVRLLREKPELRIVADQIGSPTWTRPLARQVIGLAGRMADDRGSDGPYGIYHYSDDGYLSWYEFALGIREEALAAGLIEHAPPIVPIATSDYPLPAPRPANSRFCRDKVQRDLGFTIFPWRRNLAEYFAEWRSAGFCT
ncbi:MAG: dTDP-4-dehydrorhamnose reductase [Candidatus Ozemobacter sibiricus]|uniref:dTDP-4-dehydrorhamnose reductase n=1 Tax=Candidatus Ozemobacter sibiricus TaxID=2268124 RepID=A0A367Z901_9BACT|nr:MAG: dTDP-4-dehydrorhamnose reductase [Candidatus Ozemobacter sibiricus]